MNRLLPLLSKSSTLCPYLLPVTRLALAACRTLEDSNHFPMPMEGNRRLSRPDAKSPARQSASPSDPRRGSVAENTATSAAPRPQEAPPVVDAHRSRSRSRAGVQAGPPSLHAQRASNLVTRTPLPGSRTSVTHASTSANQKRLHRERDSPSSSPPERGRPRVRLNQGKGKAVASAESSGSRASTRSSRDSFSPASQTGGSPSASRTDAALAPTSQAAISRTARAPQIAEDYQLGSKCSFINPTTGQKCSDSAKSISYTTKEQFVRHYVSARDTMSLAPR